jgi:hypothetical protein
MDGLDPAIAERAVFRRWLIVGSRCVNSTEHTSAGIPELLRGGLTPITDNVRALLELGFEGAYPHVQRGYDATIWQRSIDHGTRADGRRVLARQRAFLAFNSRHDHDDDLE